MFFCICWWMLWCFLGSMLRSFAKYALCGRSVAGTHFLKKNVCFKWFWAFLGEPVGRIHVDQVNGKSVPMQRGTRFAFSRSAPMQHGARFAFCEARETLVYKGRLPRKPCTQRSPLTKTLVYKCRFLPNPYFRNVSRCIFWTLRSDNWRNITRMPHFETSWWINICT